jgi:hypothetical protein
MAFQDAKFMELVCSLISNDFGEEVRFIQTADGLDATAKSNFQTFNCIILGSDMSKKSCIAVASSIRNSSLNAKVPILISTDNKDIETQLNLEKIPFVYVVSKEAGANALVNLISDQLKLDVNQRRLSALLLNTITDGFTQFIGSTTEIDLKVEPAKIGQFSDYCTKESVLIEVQHEWSNAEVYIKLNDHAISLLKGNFPFLKSLDYDHVRKSFSSFMLRKCLQEFSTKKTLKTKVGFAVPESLKKFSQSRGIVINLVDEAGFEINIFVLPPTF